MIDLRFPTAVQMVMSLAVAAERGQQCTSKELAAGLSANPSLVRRLLVPLGRDGIVASSLGKTGGIRLARPAAKITLRDVYLSIAERKKLLVARPNVPGVCLVSRTIGQLIDILSREAEDSLLSALGRRTIADTIEEARQLDQRAPILVTDTPAAGDRSMLAGMKAADPVHNIGAGSLSRAAG